MSLYLLLLLALSVSCADYTKTSGTTVTSATYGWIVVPWSSFGIPSLAAVTKVSVYVSSSSNIGTVSGSWGTSLNADPWWFQLDGVSVSFSGNSGVIEWEMPTSLPSKLQTSGDLKFGVWWMSCSSLKIEKFVVTTGGSSSGGGHTDPEPEEQVDEPVELPSNCPSLKKVSGGLNGSGYATRYWDCCKPHCSWTKNSNPPAKSCSKSTGNVLTDTGAKNVCENGGTAMACLSQIPFTLDECGTMGFAFAAVPASSNPCGKCFLLTFTGKGKYSTHKSHQKLSGKKLLVMASNIGYDVSGGQFDIMIPGGGVGIYNGCDGLWTGNLGAQYGGLLDDCENEIGWSYTEDVLYTKTKECLTNKCNSAFANDAQAKKGCLFLADYMEAAGNPTLTYEEVECPDFLKSLY